ncbi:MAG: YceH family protein [Ramlibacter sp.]|nr:YceH family protein [Ramlibacter sp.]
MNLPVLSAIDARVLGVLMEKARTVPDSYPLTLNSLVLGCNQRSGRDPLMNVTDAQAQDALDALKRPFTDSGQALVRETSGSRVTRWEHNFQRAIGVPEQSAVLLGLLMLRGPQTAGELRINSERWYRFADISSVEAFLDELELRSDEKGGPLVVRLPRAAGMREQRWAHLLCGPVDAAAQPSSRDHRSPARSGLEERVGALEDEVAQLRSALQNLCDQLGVSPPRQPKKHDRADN